MPTALNKPVSRQTRKLVGAKPVIVTLAPLQGQAEALIGFRLNGERTQYVVKVSDVYRVAALWHGQKEAMARREARRQGVPWRQAKGIFYRQNSIPKFNKEKATT